MSKLTKVAVIGQGYVGLPLALAACGAQFDVVGIDIDISKIDLLRKGISTIEDVDDTKIKQALESGRYFVTDSLEGIKDINIFIVCVPTPLNKDRKPDLSYLIEAVSVIGEVLSEESLVIIESTIEPGTTRDIVHPILKSKSRHSDFQINLAFSPERIDPNNRNWHIKNTPKLVAGLDDKSTELARDFYSSFVSDVIICNSLEIAETAKLLENTFRFINISFINELSIFCEKLGIDITEVIKAASTKPYGFLPFHPSLGIGGHCIPVDPLYLSNKAKEIGVDTKFIDLADQINHEIPKHVVVRAELRIGKLHCKNILIIGVSYKENIADVRETPVKQLIDLLREKGAFVSWHDDLVKEWNGEKSTPITDTYDLIILATQHDNVDIRKFDTSKILNTRDSI
jgi:UDP-N-acetyl-D-glucosamine dehydrogenase